MIPRAGGWPGGFGGGPEQEEDGECPGGCGEEASVRACGASAEEGVAGGVGLEQVATDGPAAVGYAEEEGFAPVEGGMKTDRPPEGAGAPEGEAHEQGEEAHLGEAGVGFAGVAAVVGDEEAGEEGGGCPEAEGAAVFGFEPGAVDPGQAAREGELHVGAERGFFGESDHEKGDGPDARALQDGRAVQGQASEDEETGGPEAGGERGDAEESGEQTGGKAAELAWTCAAVGREWPAFDAGHDPGGDGEIEEDVEAGEDEWARIERVGLRGWSVAGEQESVDLADCDREDQEEEQAPACAEAFGADEEVAQEGGFGRCRRRG